ncbi:MAG: DUF3179 domain-containing protein [SAR202 cluster bacterium]|nr:DUF3179 domain-containing protein [SAR202 cluster bacterium]
MNAMTWYDHETDTLWSQPNGAALKGEYAGLRLAMIATSIEPWGTWKRDNPDTLVLSGPGLNPGFSFDPFDGRQGEYVLGVTLGDDARAYPLRSRQRQGRHQRLHRRCACASRRGPQGQVGPPVCAPNRRRATEVRTGGGELRDVETGSLWSPFTGLALQGEFRGQGMRQIPFSTAYYWAWEDFYPQTTFYRD